MNKVSFFAKGLVSVFMAACVVFFGGCGNNDNGSDNADSCEITFKSTFNGNETSLTAKFPKGETIVLYPMTSPEDGYAFNCWSLSPSQSGACIGDSYTVKGNATLYAKWKKSTYNITFDSDGATPVSNQNNVAHATTIILPATTKAGFTFEGWFDADDKYIGGAGDSYTVKSDADLTAKWKQNFYTVKFNSNGGTLADSIPSVTHGSAIPGTCRPDKKRLRFRRMA